MYIKTEWKARKGTRLNKFTKSQETALTVLLENTPDEIMVEGTPFSVDNMNHIEEGIYEAHEMIADEEASRIQGDMDTLEEANEYTRQTVLTEIQTHNTNANAHADIRNIINTLIGLPEWDSSNHIITFTAKDGSTLEVNIPLEELTRDIDFDPLTKEIILIKHDGTEIRIDIGDLVDVYTGSIGTHIQITVGDDNQIKAVLRAGSITETELSAALLAKIDEKADRNEVIPLSEKGFPGGVATLDENGKLHPDQTPGTTAQFLAAHPVGSIYMTAAPDESTVSQMAAKYGGTWTVWGAGRTPVGAGTSDRAFAIGERGGASTHILKEEQIPPHTHTQDPHSHSVWADITQGDDSRIIYAPFSGISPYATKVAQPTTAVNQNTGGGQGHNNLQPYETCYMYQRSA
jgi:hypothetical protein